MTKTLPGSVGPAHQLFRRPGVSRAFGERPGARLRHRLRGARPVQRVSEHRARASQPARDSSLRADLGAPSPVPGRLFHPEPSAGRPRPPGLRSGSRDPEQPGPLRCGGTVTMPEPITDEPTADEGESRLIVAECFGVEVPTFQARDRAAYTRRCSSACPGATSPPRAAARNSHGTRPT